MVASGPTGPRLPSWLWAVVVERMAFFILTMVESTRWGLLDPPRGASLVGDAGRNSSGSTWIQSWWRPALLAGDGAGFVLCVVANGKCRAGLQLLVR